MEFSELVEPLPMPVTTATAAPTTSTCTSCLEEEATNNIPTTIAAASTTTTTATTSKRRRAATGVTNMSLKTATNQTGSHGRRLSAHCNRFFFCSPRRAAAHALLAFVLATLLCASTAAASDVTTASLPSNATISEINDSFDSLLKENVEEDIRNDVQSKIKSDIEAASSSSDLDPSKNEPEEVLHSENYAATNRNVAEDTTHGETSESQYAGNTNLQTAQDIGKEQQTIKDNQVVNIVEKESAIKKEESLNAIDSARKARNTELEFNASELQATAATTENNSLTNSSETPNAPVGDSIETILEPKSHQDLQRLEGEEVKEHGDLLTTAVEPRTDQRFDELTEGLETKNEDVEELQSNDNEAPEKETTHGINSENTQNQTDTESVISQDQVNNSESDIAEKEDVDFKQENNNKSIQDSEREAKNLNLIPDAGISRDTLATTENDSSVNIPTDSDVSQGQVKSDADKSDSVLPPVEEIEAIELLTNKHLGDKTEDLVPQKQSEDQTDNQINEEELVPAIDETINALYSETTGKNETLKAFVPTETELKTDNVPNVLEDNQNNDETTIEPKSPDEAAYESFVLHESQNEAEVFVTEASLSTIEEEIENRDAQDDTYANTDEEEKHQIIKKPGVDLKDVQTSAEQIETEAIVPEELPQFENDNFVTESNERNDISQTTESQPNANAVETEPETVVESKVQTTVNNISNTENESHESSEEQKANESVESEENKNEKEKPKIDSSEENKDKDDTSSIFFASSKDPRSVNLAANNRNSFHAHVNDAKATPLMTFSPLDVEQTLHDNLADEGAALGVGDALTSDHANSSLATSRSVIIIAICSSVASLFIVISLAIFLISCQRQRGTLDIEMQEQRCGKDNLNEEDAQLKLLELDVIEPQTSVNCEETDECL